MAGIFRHRKGMECTEVQLLLDGAAETLEKLVRIMERVDDHLAEGNIEQARNELSKPLER